MAPNTLRRLRITLVFLTALSLGFSALVIFLRRLRNSENRHYLDIIKLLVSTILFVASVCALRPCFTLPRNLRGFLYLVPTLLLLIVYFGYFIRGGAQGFECGEAHCILDQCNSVLALGTGLAALLEIAMSNFGTVKEVYYVPGGNPDHFQGGMPHSGGDGSRWAPPPGEPHEGEQYPHQSIPLEPYPQQGEAQTQGDRTSSSHRPIAATQPLPEQPHPPTTSQPPPPYSPPALGH